MTFDQKEQMQGRLISLECALVYYNRKSDIETLDKLMTRLMLHYTDDKSIESDCEMFISSFDELMKRFDREVS